MSQIPANPSQFDKTQDLISGIPVSIYNLKSLEPYLKSYNDKGDQPNPPDIPINVMYFVHGLQNSQSHSEKFGSYVAEHFSKARPDTPFIFITYDHPNHGARKVRPESNKAWDEGNDKHGPDLISLVEGSVNELKLIVDQLAFHLNLDKYLPQLSDYNFKFHNLVCGFSLGGHITLRFAQKYPEDVQLIAPLAGSSDLSSLLVERLLQIKPTSKKRFLQEYSELQLTAEQKLKYPKSLHEYIRKTDEAIFDNFPYKSVKMYAAFGANDTKVPAAYTRTFCSVYKIENPSTTVFTDENAAHEVTVKMLDNLATWLVENY